MSRYVDADEILRELRFVQKARAFKDNEILGSIIKDFEEMQEHIVRCKDCIHNPWKEDYDNTCIWDDDFADRWQTKNDFCSYGERKEEGE